MALPALLFNFFGVDIVKGLWKEGKAVHEHGFNQYGKNVQTNWNTLWTNAKETDRAAISQMVSEGKYKDAYSQISKIFKIKPDAAEAMVAEIAHAQTGLPIVSGRPKVLTIGGEDFLIPKNFTPDLHAEMDHAIKLADMEMGTNRGIRTSTVDALNKATHQLRTASGQTIDAIKVSDLPKTMQTEVIGMMRENSHALGLGNSANVKATGGSSQNVQTTDPHAQNAVNAAEQAGQTAKASNAANTGLAGEGIMGKLVTKGGASAGQVNILPGFNGDNAYSSLKNTWGARALVGEGMVGGLANRAVNGSGKALGFASVANTIKYGAMGLINSIPFIGNPEKADASFQAMYAYGVGTATFVGMRAAVPKVVTAIGEGFTPKAWMAKLPVAGKVLGFLGKGLPAITMFGKSIPGVAAAATLVTGTIEVTFALCGEGSIGTRLARAGNAVVANGIEGVAGFFGGPAGMAARQAYVEGSKALFGENVAPMDSAAVAAYKGVRDVFTTDVTAPQHTVSPSLHAPLRENARNARDFAYSPDAKSMNAAALDAAKAVGSNIGANIQNVGTNIGNSLSQVRPVAVPIRTH